MKRLLYRISLILFSATVLSAGAIRAQTEPANEPIEVIERNDAAASALARSIYEQLPEQDKVNQPLGTQFWSWDVTYQPQYGTIKVERDQEVLMESGVVINGDGKKRPPTLARPGFTLLIESFLSPAEYVRFKAENDAVYKQLDEMYEQMLHQRIDHKFDSFLPKTEEEKKTVDAYDKLKRKIHHLPDYYFRNMSVSWVTAGYDELFHRPGETPRRFTVRADEQESWEREQAQAVQAVLKIVSHYESEAK